METSDTPMSLREQCIEAMARAILETEHKPPLAESKATAALDALLVVLAEHDRKQRKMEWPFSFPEYLKMLRVS